VARAGRAQLYLVDVSLARRLGRTPRVVLVSEVRRRVRDAAPRRAIEARIGEQLLVTAPLLVVAVAAEYALADAVRRPCEGGFRCLGLAIFGPPSLIVAPVMFGVLSSLALALIQGTEGPAPPASPGHSSVPCSAPR
jgi:hypothetical protein